MSFSSLTLGQYVPTGSLIHRLDPRAKLFSLLFLVTSVFASKTPLSLGAWSLVLVGLVALARLPWRSVLRSCRPIFWLAAFTFIFNAGALLWDGGALLPALLQGGFVALRLLVLMAFAVLLPVYFFTLLLGCLWLPGGMRLAELLVNPVTRGLVGVITWLSRLPFASVRVPYLPWYSRQRWLWRWPRGIPFSQKRKRCWRRFWPWRFPLGPGG